MTPRIADTFQDVLADVQGATGWKGVDLAAKLGISTKTLGRYTIKGDLPPVSRRHGIVHALRELPRPLLARVAASLAVSSDFAIALPRPARDPELARPALEAALLEVAEKLDSGPIRVRRALGVFLSRLVDAELDAKSAATLLAGR